MAAAVESFKEDEEDSVASAAAPISGVLLRMTSRRQRTIVRQAVASMTDAPLFVILDFRWVEVVLF